MKSAKLSLKKTCFTISSQFSNNSMNWINDDFFLVLLIVLNFDQGGAIAQNDIFEIRSLKFRYLNYLQERTEWCNL